jgi:hypothetical protein
MGEWRIVPTHLGPARRASLHGAHTRWGEQIKASERQRAEECQVCGCGCPGERMDLGEAYEVLKKARPIASPNAGFARQLADYSQAVARVSEVW